MKIGISIVALVCVALLTMGASTQIHDFYIEMFGGDITINQTDVIDLYEGIAYEITVSESDKSIQEKNKSYPESLEVKKIDAKTFKECDLL